MCQSAMPEANFPSTLRPNFELISRKLVKEDTKDVSILSCYANIRSLTRWELVVTLMLVPFNRCRWRRWLKEDQSNFKQWKQCLFCGWIWGSDSVLIAPHRSDVFSSSDDVWVKCFMYTSRYIWAVWFHAQWQWVSMHHTRTRKLKQLIGIQPR